MSAELCLQRFDRASDDGPVRANILVDLAALAKRLLADEGRTDPVATTDLETVTIDLDGGTFELHATHGVIPIAALDKTRIRLAFEIAREADMVIIAEGGKHRAMLTNAKQYDALPPDWISDRAEAPVCNSPAELERLLADWFKLHGRYVAQIRSELSARFNTRSLSGVPGTQYDSQNEYIYIEAHAGESADMHRRAIGKDYSAALKAGVGTLPKNGLLASTNWLLMLPTGEKLYAHSVSGDKDAWLSALRKCAKSLGRAAGRISRRGIFILDDGRIFPLADCTIERE